MKIYYNGKPYRDTQGKFSSIWKSIKWFSKRVAIGTSIIVLLASVYVAGGYGNPVVRAELVKEGLPPVLQKIAKCESGNSQFKNGQVLINATQDMGKYQINLPTWGKKATELGYNLSTEQGNEDMALWLYKNKGTGSWSSSSKCWQ